MSPSAAIDDAITGLKVPRGVFPMPRPRADGAAELVTSEPPRRGARRTLLEPLPSPAQVVGTDGPADLISQMADAFEKCIRTNNKQGAFMLRDAFHRAHPGQSHVLDAAWAMARGRCGI